MLLKSVFSNKVPAFPEQGGTAGSVGGHRKETDPVREHSEQPYSPGAPPAGRTLLPGEGQGRHIGRNGLGPLGHQHSPVPAWVQAGAPAEVGLAGARVCLRCHRDGNRGTRPGERVLPPPVKDWPGLKELSKQQGPTWKQGKVRWGQDGTQQGH